MILDRTIGKFEIRMKLGRGGMADVYLARDRESGELVALKLIEHAADADTVASIEAEELGAVLQARLCGIDPRVARVFEWGELGHFFHVTMEYVEGQDLSELIRLGPLAPGRAAAIAADVCETLRNAHTMQAELDGKQFHGIVHGDIKPRNIRIDLQGHVRLLDFGIAKALSLSRRLTRNDFGSVAYASPERLESGDVDATSDIWSLGVVLYEMVAGGQPFRAESTERLERMIRRRTSPERLPESCPEPLRRIIAKALAAEAGERYPSAEEFLGDLTAFLSGNPVLAPPEDEGDRTRRTHPLDEADSDRTRRTQPGTEEGSGTRRTQAGAGARGALSKGRSYFRTGTRAMAVLLLAWFAYSGVSNYTLWKHGRQFQREIDAEVLTDLERIWTQWQELAKDRTTSLLLMGPRHSVSQKMVAAADRVIATYRNNDSRPVYENEWKRARTYLSRALELDPGDRQIKGELRLCEAHILRIDGSTHHDENKLNDAVEKFSESARLLPKSPDPELGLARIYVYGMKDIDRAAAALHEAKERGYSLGRRENAQLADGYRDRADQIWRDSRKLTGLPQEAEQLRKARDDYWRALKLYQSIVPFQYASDNIARVQSSLDGVEYRLKELN